jgi:alkylation response protein AidB-like acyl-CoA dehydrogenase
MNFDPRPDDEAFRRDIRAFLAASLPADMAQRGLQGYLFNKDDSVRWTKILQQRGWSVPHWPKEHGGPGWTGMQRYIFDEECFLAGTPPILEAGTTLVGPVIYTFGSEAQKRRFLPPIIGGDMVWCQGFSEPGAGSDLASLRTRADRDGDHYFVNGSKIWTSLAQHADWIFCLVRTSQDVKPQQGISFLLFDVKSPGVTIQPIISIDGCHHLNQVFFDNVRVPAENLIGEENKGWGYTKFLLGNERAFAGANVPLLKRYLMKLKRMARQERSGGRPLIEDAAFSQKLAQLELEVKGIDVSVLRVIQEGEATSEGGWAIGSVLKVRGTELQQQLTTLMMEAVGDYSAVFYPDPDLAGLVNQLLPGPDYAAGLGADFFYHRACTIYGGSNEIQRGIIAKLALQL